MKNIFLYIFVIIVAAACSGMNDLHEKYLNDGEAIHVAKFDSLYLYGDKESVMLVYWLSDPKAKKARVYWSLRTDSLTFDVSATGAEPGVVSIDRNDAGKIGLDAGMTSFEIYTYNEQFRNRSVPMNEAAMVYGEKYENSLLNRSINSELFDGQDFIINWAESRPNEIGISLTYTDVNGVQNIIVDPSESRTYIFDFNNQEPVFYSTMYQFNALSDYVYHVPTVERMYDHLDPWFVLDRDGWIANANAFVNATFVPANVLDGDLGTAWHIANSSPVEYPHWLSVDMLKVYKVKALYLYQRDYGAESNAGRIFKNFKIQGSMDGVEWTDCPPAPADRVIVDGDEYYEFKEIKFERQTFNMANMHEMRHIRIWAINTGSANQAQRWSSVAELEVLGTTSFREEVEE